MQLCLVEFTRPNKETGEFFSPEFVDAISKHDIDEIILFQPTDHVCLELREELKVKLPKATLRPELLDPISSDMILHEMKQQPWNLLRQILSKLDETQESLFVLGRGANLLQHTLWLTAEIRGSKTISIDEPNVDLFQIGTTEINTEIANATMGSFVSLHIQEINENITGKNGWFSANDISKLPGAVTSGINAATQLALKEGYLLKEDTTSGNTVYKLTPKGWTLSLKNYIESKGVEDEGLKEILISFARLPKIVSAESHNSPPPLLMSQISAAGIHDGLLVVLQKIDDSIEGTHVMTLDEACDFFTEPELIGDLRAAKEILRQRCVYDCVEVKNHLVVVNPDYGEDFQLLFSKHLLAALEDFEKQYGRHHWDFDITSPVNPIKPAVSSFSNVAKASTCYILKSKGEKGAVIEKVELSRHPRYSHKLSVPNCGALEIMNTKIAPGYRNVLVALMLLENVNSKKSSHRLPFDDVEEDDFDGIEWSEIVTFVEELKCPYDLKKGIVTGSATRMKKLIQSKLVHRNVAEEGSSIHRFSLTNEGYLVASQLYGDISREGMA